MQLLGGGSASPLTEPTAVLQSVSRREEDSPLAQLLLVLAANGHTFLVSTLRRHQLSELSLCGLHDLLRRDVKAFHEMAQACFACDFANSLALAAALTRLLGR